MLSFLMRWLRPQSPSQTPLGLAGGEGAEARRDKTAVMFLLDSAYLIGLKTLLYTLRNAYDPALFDLVILTNDPKVGEDPFVRNVIDHVVLVDQQQIARFSRVKKSRVKSRLRRRDVGKYTFLKFLSYSDFGYRDRIFIDTDIICLRDDFQLSELVGDWDFAVAPSVGGVAMQMEDTGVEKLDFSDEQRAEFTRLTRWLAEQPRDPGYSFNSGVTYAKNTILSDDTVRGMIEIASQDAFGQEQAVVRTYIASQGDAIRFKSLPIWYNFTQLPALAMGPRGFEEVRPEIRLLHYNRTKPWAVGRAGADWMSAIWYAMHDEAQPWIAERSRPGSGRSAG